MSKVDALRALREAKYAAAAVPTVTAKAAPEKVASAQASAKPRAAAKPKPAAMPSPAAEISPELCGHRSMNGRSCTRPGGHSEMNHRYG